MFKKHKQILSNDNIKIGNLENNINLIILEINFSFDIGESIDYEISVMNHVKCISAINIMKKEKENL